MKFKGNFGELTLEIEGTKAKAKYQNGGVMEGEFINDTFKGTWKNKGKEGLVEFKVENGKLIGNWKQGLDAGPMKGKWEGEMINEERSMLSDDVEIWDIDLVKEKEILTTNCEGISGQDVRLNTSSFLPKNNFENIVNYLNAIFFDDDANYLFKYKKYADGEIVLFASTYLLKLDGNVLDIDIDGDDLRSVLDTLNNNGVSQALLSSIEKYTEEGCFTVGDLIEDLLVEKGQTITVNCIDNIYGNDSYEIHS